MRNLEEPGGTWKNLEEPGRTWRNLEGPGHKHAIAASSLPGSNKLLMTTAADKLWTTEYGNLDKIILSQALL